MTPKEKAEELVYKYKDASFNCLGCDMPFCDAPCTMLNIDESKQCALITVDEVWRQLESARVFEEYDYWQEVKKEIEKI